MFVFVCILQINDGIIRDFQKAQLGSNLHIANHGSTNQHDFAVIANGSINYLLNPMHVRGKGSHNHALGGASDDIVQYGTNVFF